LRFYHEAFGLAQLPQRSRKWHSLSSLSTGAVKDQVNRHLNTSSYYQHLYCTKHIVRNCNQSCIMVFADNWMTCDRLVHVFFLDNFSDLRQISLPFSLTIHWFATDQCTVFSSNSPTCDRWSVYGFHGQFQWLATDQCFVFTDNSVTCNRSGHGFL
jgi:hypothetical protein